MPKAPEPSSTCQKTTKSLPRISPKSYCYNAVPNRFLAHFSTSRTNGPRSLSWAKAGTHATPALNRAHSGLHAETGAVSDGGAVTTLGLFCAGRKPCVAGCQNGVLCRFWALVGGVSAKSAESLRDSDALMRVAVPQASRPRWAA